MAENMAGTITVLKTEIGRLMEKNKQLKQAEVDLAHSEAVLIDCQKAHDVTIADRDEFRGNYTRLRAIIDVMEKAGPPRPKC